MAEHYFTADPSSAANTSQRRVTLRGQEVEVVTGSGVFSPTRVDPGTSVLLRHVPDPPPEGVLVDLGCGWGPLTIALAQASPEARVLAVDVNARARELTALNAQRLGLANVVTMTPEAALEDHAGEIAALWSNPPIRIGKAALRELLAAWLRALAPDGEAHLVVSKNLGGDSLHRWLDEELGAPTQRVGSAKGFRVLRAARAAD
ncbi:MAG TPA: methyltransferase [Actinomycetaceae bacterium]|nr:methyltransferase [Actinomycetaceae bacterium]